MNLKFLIKTFLFLVLIAAFCCNSKENKKVTEISLLQKTKSVTLPLDDKSTYEFYKFQINKDTLIVLNQANNSLDFYDLKKETLIHRITIPVEGEDGVQKLYSFLYHNSDTIFVFSQFRVNNIKLFDYMGNYIETLIIDGSMVGNHGILNHASLPSMPTYFFEKSLYFQVMPAFDEEMMDDYFINEFILDTESGKLTPDSIIKKPKSLHNTSKYTYGLNRLKLNKFETIYSWKYSDTLFYVNEENNESIVNKSIFFGDKDLIKVGSERDLTDLQIRNISAKSHQYGKIMYDKEKEIVHRIKYLPVSNDDGGNLYLIRDFEIISGDLKGNVIGKTHFKGGLYDPRVGFFGSDGIYLPKINPNYQNIMEDIIEYDVYQVTL